MSLDLTILPSASSLEGLVRSPSALSSARLKPFVAGDRERVTLRLVDDLGQVIDPTGYVFRVGLGPINRHPTDGSLSIDDGSDSATIPAGSTADEVKQLLDTMNGGSGIYSGGPCDVVGNPGGPWFITVGDVGAIALPTVGGSDLQPASLVSVIETVAGTPLVRPQFVLRAFQQPLAYQDQWVVNGDQVEGILNLGTEGIYRVLPEGVSSHQTHFEIELTDAGGFIQTVVQVPARIQGEVIGLGAGGTNEFSAFLTLATANNLFTLRDGSNLTDPAQWRSALDVTTGQTQITQSRAIDRNALVLREGYATIDDAPDLRPGTSSFTIAGWVRALDDDQNNQHVITKGSVTSTYPSWAGFGIARSTSGGGRFVYVDHEGGAAVNNLNSGDGTSPAGEWIHYALVRDVAEGQLRWYINGELSSQQAMATIPDFSEPGVDVRIGARTQNNKNASGPYLSGDIGETHMLSFAADADDVRKLMVGDIPIEWRGGAFGGSDGVVLHLDPRNIGPAPSQWIEPNGHHALYHTTGVDSAQELEEATLKFSYDFDPNTGGSMIFLGGARDVLPVGWTVSEVYITSNVDNVTTWRLLYSDGTSDYEFATISTGVMPENWNGQAFPGIASTYPGANMRRIILDGTSSSGEAGVVTLKIKKIV